MNNGFLDRALSLATLAAVGGLYWKMFDVGESLARLEVRFETVEFRLENVESQLDDVETQLGSVGQQLMLIDPSRSNDETKF